MMHIVIIVNIENERYIFELKRWTTDHCLECSMLESDNFDMLRVPSSDSS